MLNEIRARWASRKWPTIGYFVHGQAYKDISELIKLVDYYRVLAHGHAGAHQHETPTTEYDKGAQHACLGIRAVIKTMPRYNPVIGAGTGGAFMIQDDEHGRYIKVSDVLELMGESNG